MPSRSNPPSAIRAAPIDAEVAPGGAKWAAVPVLPQAAAPSRTATAPAAGRRAPRRAVLTAATPCSARCRVLGCELAGPVLAGPVLAGPVLAGPVLAYWSSCIAPVSHPAMTDAECQIRYVCGLTDPVPKQGSGASVPPRTSQSSGPRPARRSFPAEPRGAGTGRARHAAGTRDDDDGGTQKKNMGETGR